MFAVLKFQLLGENSMSSPMQNRRNMTFNRRKVTNCYSSSPRKDETFSKISPATTKDGIVSPGVADMLLVFA